MTPSRLTEYDPVTGHTQNSAWDAEAEHDSGNEVALTLLCLRVEDRQEVGSLAFLGHLPHKRLPLILFRVPVSCILTQRLDCKQQMYNCL